jgi:glycosyltransferase domain-containing protein
MMRDFTLVISTCNCAQLLAALLNYLETERADCHVLVLDSSRPELLAANRARVTDSSLDVELVEVPDLEPDEKRRRGIHKVTTRFCAVCTDRDLVILEGVRECLEILRTNLMASVVQGCSFSFLPRSDGDVELNDIMHFGRTIDDLSPMRRLISLLQRYQSPLYGVFRTAALQRILDTLQPMTKALARDLLWTALTVIEGHHIGLSSFTYGRRRGSSDRSDCWHPLEWFCKDADGMFAEYLRYRELLASALTRRPDNDLQSEEVRDLLDLIHLRFLAQHAPDSVLEFIASQEIASIDFANDWPPRRFPLPPFKATSTGTPAESETLSPFNVRGRDRGYLLFPGFYAPARSDQPQFDSVVRLIGILDSYRPTTDGSRPTRPI